MSFHYLYDTKNLKLFFKILCKKVLGHLLGVGGYWTRFEILVDCHFEHENILNIVKNVLKFFGLAAG